jgi:hypothetical protein
VADQHHPPSSGGYAKVLEDPWRVRYCLAAPSHSFERARGRRVRDPVVGRPPVVHCHASAPSSSGEPACKVPSSKPLSQAAVTTFDDALPQRVLLKNVDHAQRVEVAIVGFKTNLWWVAAAIGGHGLFDFVHHWLIESWSAAVVAGLLLGVRRCVRCVRCLCAECAPGRESARL